MSGLTVSARGLVVAGSNLTFDGLQVSRATLVGLSGNTRANEWGYDAQGRLAAASYGREIGAPATAIEVLSPADDRLAHQRPVPKAGDPLSLAFQSAKGHKMVEFTRGSEVRSFAYGGAERIDDGNFTYEYDLRGRLVRATEKGSGSIRRVLYFYSGTNRVVGRRAEYGPAGGPFKLEDRADILAADTIPAEVTYSWDPINDRIAAIWRAGSSATPSIDPNGGLVRQIIHGSLGYDDPIEVAIADNATVRRIYPIFDEAAAGGLQLIINSDGEVISRQLSQDPYGGEESTLAGAGVDKITVTARKSPTGAILSVEVSVRLTEDIAPATLPTGARIAGTTVAPTLATPSTIRWTFTAAEWAALPTLNIAITNTLRAAAWSASTPILPPPDWALTSKPVFTSATTPFEYRESLASLITWLASIPYDENRTTTLYEVENPASLAGLVEAPLNRLIVAATFQALPFQEPITGLAYARDRWVDPRTGSFLTPDRMRYLDSPNMYAFCGGDPVNCRDPRGEASVSGRLLNSALELLEPNPEADPKCIGTPDSLDCMSIRDRVTREVVGDLKSEALPPVNVSGNNQAIVYVNGVDTDRTVASATATVIAAIYDSAVYTVWNPTHSRRWDIAQTLIGNKSSTPDASVTEVLRTIRSLLASRSFVTLMAHSQGAAIASAALGYLPMSQRRRVDVVTFGGAALTYPKGLKSLRVVVNVQDVVPWSVGYVRAEKLGMPVPGIERVSFGGGKVWDVGGTHSIFKYLQMELNHGRGGARDLPDAISNATFTVYDQLRRAIR